MLGYVQRLRGILYAVKLVITWIAAICGTLQSPQLNIEEVLILALAFFHVEVEGPEAVQWLNKYNVRIVVIKDGEITERELAKINEVWKINWFWQIGQFSAKRFLVRFPPSKSIKDM
jgi:hypothetical protein